MYPKIFKHLALRTPVINRIVLERDRLRKELGLALQDRDQVSQRLGVTLADRDRIANELALALADRDRVLLELAPIPFNGLAKTVANCQARFDEILT